MCQVLDQALIKQAVSYGLQALLNIISNPVNSTVPIAAEVLKQKGTYDPKRLFGVTTLDVVSLTPICHALSGLLDSEVSIRAVKDFVGIHALIVCISGLTCTTLSHTLTTLPSGVAMSDVYAGITDARKHHCKLICGDPFPSLAGLLECTIVN